MSLEDVEKRLYRLKADQPSAEKKSAQKKKETRSSEEMERAREQIHERQVLKASEGQVLRASEGQVLRASEGWNEISAKEAQEEHKEHFPRWVKIMLVVMGVFTVATAGLVLFFIIGIGNKSADIEITVSGPREIERGVPFDISVGFQNQGTVVLQHTTLALQLPGGIVDVNTVGNQTAIEDTIGNVGGGSFTKKTYQVLATGEKDSLQKVRAILSYGIGNSRFEKDAWYEVRVKEVAITLAIEKPEQVLSGSAFSLNVTYKNVSSFDFPNVALVAQYPPSFSFISSSITPRSLNNRWEIGELKSGSSGGFIIDGSFENASGNELNIPIVAFVSFLGKDYLVNETLASITLAPSPLKLEIIANNREQYIARIGDAMTYTIRYQNMSGVALNDVVVKANMTGELFDMASVESAAAIDPLTQTLTWNVSRVPTLKLIDAAAAGEVQFKVKIKNQFPIRRLNDKNFYLRVNASIDSPTVPYYLAAAKTSATASLETKVGGLVSFETKAFYRDAAAQIVNSGVFPPKVNTPTQYTVHWIIRNYATDIRAVKVKAFLESGVNWTGVVKSNVFTVPIFDERSREVTWDIDAIPATTGIISDPIEAIFQIQAIPNITQAYQFQPLIGISRFEAIDDFTVISFNSSDNAITTALPDDTTIRQDEGKVVQ